MKSKLQRAVYYHIKTIIMVSNKKGTNNNNNNNNNIHNKEIKGQVV